MKINDNFLLKEIAGTAVVVPTGDDLINLNSMISINETGAFLWKLLENGASESELLSKLTAEYDVDEETARQDIEEFLNILRKAGALDEQ